MLEKVGSKLIWKTRLDNTKWILTLLIVLYHIPVPANANGFAHAILLYVKNLGECVVTSFSLISGFLFFYNAQSMSDIYIKMKRRVWTLLIPYMLWNIVNSFYFILRNKGFSGLFQGIITADWAKNIILWDSSPHFWYIFMLIFWTILAPLLFVAYRHKGLFIILLLSQIVYFIYKGPDILTSRYIYILYTWSGYLGSRFPDLLQQIGQWDEKKRKIMFYICLTTYISIRLLYSDVSNNAILVWCYGVRSLFLILALMNAPYEYIGAKTNYCFSFWLFAVHYYLDAVISGYVCKYVPVFTVQFLSWIIVLALALMSGIIIKYISPGCFSVLTGNRNKKTY